MKYNVWSIPTPKGHRTFGWPPRKLNDTPLDKESADELRHLSSVDARTPDQDEYVRYVVQPVALTVVDLQAIETIPTDAFVSRERMAELESLARSGYPASAVALAIREAVYAVQQQIMIPPTTREYT